MTTPSATTAGTRVRALALYLPQYHPIPENDEWWGAGFTEWRNVARARPLYRGHVQPKLPGALGFYDLRVPEVREHQAELAREAGIEGFVYWHYWFGGRQVLERPLREVMASGRPDYPFCVAWANESWTGHWHGNPRSMLIEQTYPGEEDHRSHFAHLEPLLKDERYVRVDGKPLVLVYNPSGPPAPRRLTELWRDCADAAGLPGLHLVGFDQSGGDWDPRADGYDGSVVSNFYPALDQRPSDPLVLLRRRLAYWGFPHLFPRWRKPERVISYRRVTELQIPPHTFDFEAYPSVLSNWDNTPRTGRTGSVAHGSTPELYARHLEAGIRFTEHNRDREHRLVFLKSWNEWAEGNYLEPDAQWGDAYLRATHSVLSRT